MRQGSLGLALLGLVLGLTPWLGPEGMRWGPQSAPIAFGLFLLGGLLFLTGLLAWSSKAPGGWVVRNTLSYAAMIALAVFLIAPFVWMVLVSLHPSKSAIPTLANIMPREPAFENYRTVLFNDLAPVGRFFLNTLFVTVTVVAGQLLICSMAAYGFARLRFRGREALFTAFLLSMMFAGPVTQIPVYLMVRSAGLLDTMGALIIPSLGSSFTVFLLRQFFMQLPKELDEAARLDGASDWTIYSKVIVPLSRTALTTAGVFTFVAVWMDFFWPLIAISTLHKFTLEVGLAFFKNSYGDTNWPLSMTAAVIVMTPLLIVFLLTQRYFVKGITVGALK